jgi:tetratricopeptide repeat protein
VGPGRARQPARCLDHATGTCQHARIIALTAGLAALLSRDGPWAEAITRHATALRAAQHLGDRPDQVGAFTSLGNVRRLAGDYPGAARAREEALGIYRDLGDRGGEVGPSTRLGRCTGSAVTSGSPGQAASSSGTWPARSAVPEMRPTHWLAWAGALLPRPRRRDRRQAAPGAGDFPADRHSRSRRRLRRTQSSHRCATDRKDPRSTERRYDIRCWRVMPRGRPLRPAGEPEPIAIGRGIVVFLATLGR